MTATPSRGVPAADNLRPVVEAMVAQGDWIYAPQRVTVAADLLDAIDALPDSLEMVIPTTAAQAKSPQAYREGWADAMSEVKALLHPEENA